MPIAQRDRTFGVNDKQFWDWWHRVGKEQTGQDIGSRQEAEEAYQEWVDLGKPSAPKG